MVYMVRKILVLVTWLPLTLIALTLNLTILHLTAQQAKTPLAAENITQNEAFQVAVAGTSQVLGASIEAGDGREILLQHFLGTHKSPLYPYAQHLVMEADKYAIDYRLVPAIAMCESNLGKRIPSKDSFNAWGIAVYTGQLNGAKFRDWPSAISWVSEFIKEKFYDRGINNLQEIGSIWAPPSVETGYSWTNCVQTFMGEIH